jgi:hypothetical protein
MTGPKPPVGPEEFLDDLALMLGRPLGPGFVDSPLSEVVSDSMEWLLLLALVDERAPGIEIPARIMEDLGSTTLRVVAHIVSSYRERELGESLH